LLTSFACVNPRRCASQVHQTRPTATLQIQRPLLDVSYHGTACGRCVGMSNNIGYARVSTTDQSTDLQVDALTVAGAARIFADHASGATTDRPALTSCLEYLNPGDTLLVWRIDRLGRSITDLIKLVSDLSDRDIQLRSLTEAIDTSTPGGELVFHIFAALAQMERRLLSERTRAGLAAARARGHVGGRPTVMTVEKVEAMHAGGATYTVISAALNVGRSTVRRALEKPT
jgi:DNA invertase Pin-like site-specific DNA recombinase